MTRAERTVAAIGLGGNIGEPTVTMAKALAMLDARADIDVLAVSALYRTPPWGKTDQAWFFNACALLGTTLSPEALLDVCLSVETELGRVREDRWGPRTIDLDVLLHGDFHSDDAMLTVPHPRMTERAFVMVPLADIAPDAIINLQSVEAWASHADGAGIEQLSSDGSWWRQALPEGDAA
nr:2-amino-4-hydroxy-6-hydroxymethyldihydropteridine diphosphokinase [Pseudohoeflea suaedae]